MTSLCATTVRLEDRPPQLGTSPVKILVIDGQEFDITAEAERLGINESVQIQARRNPETDELKLVFFLPLCHIADGKISKGDSAVRFTNCNPRHR